MIIYFIKYKLYNNNIKMEMITGPTCAIIIENDIYDAATSLLMLRSGQNLFIVNKYINGLKNSLLLIERAITKNEKEVVNNIILYNIITSLNYIKKKKTIVKRLSIKDVIKARNLHINTKMNYWFVNYINKIVSLWNNEIMFLKVDSLFYPHLFYQKYFGNFVVEIHHLCSNCKSGDMKNKLQNILDDITIINQINICINLINKY